MAGEIGLRLGVFLGLFALFALAEALWPRRPLHLPRPARWRTNLAITLLDAVMLRATAVLIPALAIGAAVDAQAGGCSTLWARLSGWRRCLRCCCLILRFGCSI
ncbi:hypothetical protein [Gemmobacter denitrificans]|uniref:Uncharacterized protein n=1 Tax=Gemmobacter denitrificans TaxID=3123040 RepID=A0ABU8BW46_9RHOB